MIFRKKPSQPSRRQLPEILKGRTQVFSYYAKRADEPEQRRERLVTPTARREKSARWQQIPIILATLAIIVSVLYSLTLDNQVSISVIELNNSTLLREATEYEQGFETILKSSIYNRTKLTVDTISLAEQIKERYPELEAVSVTIPLLGHHPIVTIASAQPAFLLRSNGRMYVVDEQGRAIAERLTGVKVPADLVTVIDETGVVVESGETLLPNQSVKFITTMLYQLSSKNIALDTMILPVAASELHLRLKNQPYIIKAYLDGDPLIQSGSLIATLEHLTKSNINPKEYIDVRVEGRAYYK